MRGAAYFAVSMCEIKAWRNTASPRRRSPPPERRPLAHERVLARDAVGGEVHATALRVDPFD
jgi:hypothetical protein